VLPEMLEPLPSAAPATLLVFLASVLVSYTCAAMLGFGANVIAVALAAHVLPVQVVLPAILPSSLLLSTILAYKHRDDIRWDLLRRRILPLALLGFPFGWMLFQYTDTRPLKGLLGVSVAVLAVLELTRPATRAPRPPSVLLRSALLVSGGFVQGLFASGGPLIVHAVAREVDDKGAFRSTLSTLWCLLNSVLLVAYVASGRIDGDSLRLTAWALVPLAIGLAVGQRLHDRAAQRPFRVAIHALLLVSGVVLTLEWLAT